jgi:hypothetical protein
LRNASVCVCLSFLFVCLFVCLFQQKKTNTNSDNKSNQSVCLSCPIMSVPAFFFLLLRQKKALYSKVVCSFYSADRNFLPFGSPHILLLLKSIKKILIGRWCTPCEKRSHLGVPMHAFTFIAHRGFVHLFARKYVALLDPCYKTGCLEPLRQRLKRTTANIPPCPPSSPSNATHSPDPFANR